MDDLLVCKALLNSVEQGFYAAVGKNRLQLPIGHDSEIMPLSGRGLGW